MTQSTGKFLRSGATAALTVGMALTGWAQSTTQSTPASGIRDSEPKGTLRGDSSVVADANGSRSIADQSMVVSQINKASNLIGMEVRNPQNEKLGQIKDLVVDLPSGKVAYAVLSVGGFLGIGDKTIAIPPNAFTTDAGNDALVLNADKAKIQNAPGFAHNTWPDLNSTTWHTDSSYWTPDSTAQGRSGAVTSGTGAGTTTPSSSASDIGKHERGNSGSTAVPVQPENKGQSQDQDRK